MSGVGRRPGGWIGGDADERARPLGPQAGPRALPLKDEGRGRAWIAGLDTRARATERHAWACGSSRPASRRMRGSGSLRASTGPEPIRSAGGLPPQWSQFQRMKIQLKQDVARFPCSGNDRGRAG